MLIREQNKFFLYKKLNNQAIKMKPVSLSQIDNFLKNDTFLMYGVSRNKQKFGNVIFKELTQKGLKIFPIHREMDVFENQRCYKNLSELPEKPNAAIICTKPEKTAEILEELKNYGIQNIWLQRGSADEDIMQKANNDLKVMVCDKCILMFANPSGIHKFHSNILKFFGRYPK